MEKLTLRGDQHPPLYGESEPSPETKALASLDSAALRARANAYAKAGAFYKALQAAVFIKEPSCKALTLHDIAREQEAQGFLTEAAHTRQQALDLVPNR